MDPVTNPEAGAQATPEIPGAEAQDPGSQIDENIVVSVPHPDFDQNQQGGSDDRALVDQDQAGQGEQQAPAPDGESTEAQGDQEGQDPYMVLNYRGRDVPIASEDHLRNLAQQGFDYTVNMQMLAPHRETLKRVFQAQSDPQRAKILEAVLNGQPLEQGQPGQQPGQAREGLPRIYVRDQLGNLVYGEDGQPMLADASFVYGVVDALKGMGIDPEQIKAHAQPQPQPGYDPMLARVVNRELVSEVSEYIKQAYGREDFGEAIPLIKQEMAAMGITANDPRDNPQTWEHFYLRLLGQGKLSGDGKPQSKVKARPENKSGLKEQALHSSINPNANPGFDREAAIAKAIEGGKVDDFVPVVGQIIGNHPDFEE
jgi:hypothetical protein